MSISQPGFCHRHRGIMLALLLLIALAQSAPAARAQAATITVTSLKDNLDRDGTCSLREAIQAANTDTAVDTCAAGHGADTITLPAGV